MARFRGLLTAALVLLLLPAAASAQDDNKHTREATKHIGLAMTRQDEAERQDMYRQALAALEQGIAEEPNHAKTWFLAGAVYAALGQFAEADAAFDKAVELYPEYGEELVSEREQAWIHAFNAGVAAMDTQDYPAAIAALEAANELYDARPEAYLNLGSLYANQGQPEKAVEALEKALAIVTGPTLQEMTPETQQQWAEFAQMARINIGQLAGQAGIQAFQDEEYARSAEMFEAAAEQNPYSRDFRYNYVQALFAQAQELEEARDSALAREQAAEAERIEGELLPLYDQLLTGFEAIQPIDPNNEMIYVIAARAHRMKGLLGDEGAAKAGQDRALELLTQRDALPIEVSQLSIRTENSAAIVNGTIKNRTVAPNASVTLRLTLLGISGDKVGEGDIAVTAPAAEADATFEGTIPVTGEIAGWKYEILP